MIKKQNASFFFSSTWEKNFNSIKKHLDLAITSIEDKNKEDAKKSEDMIYFILERSLEDKEAGEQFFQKFIVHLANLRSLYEKEETKLRILDSLSERCQKTKLLWLSNKNLESAKKYFNITISDIKNKNFKNAKKNLEMLYFILDNTEENGDIALEFLKNFTTHTKYIEEKLSEKIENENDKIHFKKLTLEVTNKTMACIKNNLEYEINLEKNLSENKISSSITNLKN